MATAAGRGTTAGARSAAQTFALVVGVVYLLIGIIGFLFAEKFTGGSADDKLIIFRLNHVHNIVHVVLGLGWIFAARTHANARQINMIYGVVLLLVAVLGFINLGFMHDLLNIESAGDPDNFLHLITGAASVYFGSAGAEASAPGTA